MNRALSLTGSAVALALTVFTPAAGATHLPGQPPGDAAISQYIEQLPTSSGPRITGAGTNRRSPLPRRVANELHRVGGTDVEILGRVATNSALGAPDRRLSRPRGYGPRQQEAQNDSVAGAALSATVQAAGGGSSARLIGLALALGAIALGLVAIALTRRRNPQRDAA